MPAGVIPERAFVKGGAGYDTALTFLRAMDGNDSGIAAMENAAAEPLRQFMPPTGNLPPQALARWKQNYDGALRAVEIATPGFSSRFDDAAQATQAVLDLGIERKQAIAAEEREAGRQATIDNIARRDALGQANQADRDQVARLIAERNTADRGTDAQSRAAMQAGVGQSRGIMTAARAAPSGQFAKAAGGAVASTEVENAVGGRLKTGTGGAARMRSLVGDVAKDPDALAGLRKAGVDWMVRTFLNADGSVEGARMIDFLRNNRDTLRELYPTEQVNLFGAVARDIEVNSRWRTQTAIKGGSDTAKNLLPHISDTTKANAKHFSMMTMALEGLEKGYEHGGIPGAVLTAAGEASAYLLGTLRSVGIKSVGDLYREALADPEKARYLLSKMPDQPSGGKLRALSGLLRRELVVTPTRFTAERRAGQQ